ncbi:crossover junction endodeoxyribonuclease RuvC [Xanthobacter autotrophicus]|uniref:crossover junction endodeoxyribonuclease RuvC n=1 Tax=Xanthobacter TaxID=279 RepID=UPI0024AB7FB2|nr:crossover junction endodeoxyribonuclease RuvC [Xanthobacter autotrophicus]MDI4664915.1 crossover junction endodeoxyribonuclease RuvC [Xanthobacter autotrophicus]
MDMNAIRIIGLDPGLRRTGWGVIDVTGSRLAFVACGTILPPEQAPMGERLATLHRELLSVIERFSPHEAAVEETFVNMNPSSTLKLGQARGVVLLAPAQIGLPVAEYAALLVKKSVVGAGRAEKAQVRMMIGILLPKATPETEDAADALAVAVTHAHHRGAAARARAVL